MQACRNRDCRGRNGGRYMPRFVSLPASSTALVISSTKSGIPSVRSMMSCLMLADSDLLPTTRSIIAPMSRSPNRLSVSAVTYGCPIQGGSNSGRIRHDQKNGKFLMRSTVRPNVPSWWDQSNVCPRKSSEPAFVAPVYPFEPQGLQVFFPGAAAESIERGITAVVWQRQHLRKYRGLLLGSCGLRE